ncbi:MAG: two-partner secretion domain-containing protein [Acidiferrobacteraceae bacterium]
MNQVYRVVWRRALDAWVVVSELAKGRRKGGIGGSRRRLSNAPSGALCLRGLTAPEAYPKLSTLVVVTALMAGAGPAYAAPLGGQVMTGSGQIAQSGVTTTITQNSPHLDLNWQSFNVAPNETVRFVQPDAQALAVNHILGSNGSVIAGHIDANGQVWLINPNGILFSQTATVNAGGLVASTLDSVTPSTGATTFTGTSRAPVINKGTLTASNGGYIALLGPQVTNNGTISATLGTVALAGGNQVSLQFQGNKLLSLTVDRSAVNALAANGALVTAHGGHVFMTAGAADSLLASTVNNTGIVEAQSASDHHGHITLLGGMQAGTVQVAGTLDASAPNGGNGGSITTSAAHVHVANGATITTAAPFGTGGNWLIDPTDYTIAASGGNITGAQLSTNLGSGNITILSSGGTTGTSGNININDPVSWSANTTLTLTAANNINFNANLSATGASAGLVLNPNTANGTAAASGTGVVNFNGASSVTLSGSTPSLNISGASYTVVNSASALQAVGSTGNYALGSSLSLSSVTGFTPLGGSGFAGIFNGLGNTISGLSITSTATNVGLFGVTNAGSIIANVGMVGGTLSGSASGAAIGDLVGTTNGMITHCYATGNVAGSTSAVSSIGGLVGNNNSGTITGSYATGSVTDTLGGPNGGGLVGNDSGPITDSYATGSVNGVNDGGGLAGSINSSGWIANSYATGSVSATSDTGGLVGLNAFGSVTDSYATGSVSGHPSYTGGLIGSVVDGTITNGYWDVTSSGTTNGIGPGSSGVIGTTTGLTSAQMVISGSFTGFDFTTPVWVQYGGHTPPLLDTFLTPLTITASGISTPYSGSGYTGGLNSPVYSVTGASGSANLFNVASPYSSDVNTGTYAPSLWSNQQGYDITRAGGTLTITPATLTYHANAVTQTYGTAIPTFSGSITGFVGSDTQASATTGTLSFTTSATATSHVGSYAVDGSGLTADFANYVFQQASANTAALTINPAALTATSSVTKTYDGTTSADLGGSNTTLSGFVLGQNATVNSSVTGSFASANAGSGITITGGSLTASDLTAAGGTLLSNYTLPMSDNGSGTINPASLTYTATPATFLTGQTPAGLSGAISGFVGGQTQGSATTGRLLWTTPATAASLPGEYAIDGSGLSANFGNYVFQQAAGNSSALTMSPGTIAGFAAATLTDQAMPGVIVATNTTALPVSEVITYGLTPIPGTQRPEPGYRSTEDLVIATHTQPIERVAAPHFGGLQIRVIDGGIRFPASRKTGYQEPR